MGVCLYHGNEFTLDRITELRKEGRGEKYITDYFGLTKTDYRRYRSIMLGQDFMTKMEIYKRMKEKGISRVEICDILGVKESTLRAWDGVKTDVTDEDECES